MRQISFTLILVVTLLFSLNGIALATQVTSAVSITQNSLGDFSADADIGNAIDQSGLSTGYTSGVTDWNTYFSGNPIHDLGFNSQEWFAAGGTSAQAPSGTIIFDLGTSYSVDKLALWNEDAYGISSFDVLTSQDGISFTLVGDDLIPTNWAYSTSYGADIFDLILSTAQFVKFDLIGSIGGPSNSDYWASIGEVAFSTSASVAPIPEPSTFLLLGGGLAGLAFYARRRRKE